ncbi:cupin domain-containing protein [Algoriphagus yeomjeoni]|uniref:Quercetin dioxygenase-like cupin family protein n=1 Tax=Algoriphagus yeomjeoni TaxID=291403 RepID=A0A327P875_9BACT|nr:cupin domain-containing protein [Algoriphagus yeomjeoni]RAI88460.1 quercetin dioxygenase-like cupin family protein [Algoriphagus yeomjeoni]
MKYAKNLFLSTGILFLLFSCNSEEVQKERISENGDVDTIFPQGNQGPAENFIGKAYAYNLVPNDTTLTTLVGNVYFEPGSRSNWHTHPAGQILIITSGNGFHQIEGQPKQALKKGDTVTCPPDVRHWHGASPESGMQQIYILPNTEKGIVNWMEAVTDDVYNAQ